MLVESVLRRKNYHYIMTTKYTHISDMGVLRVVLYTHAHTHTEHFVCAVIWS